MSSNKELSCADFIVMAIRKIRYNPSNLKKGTKAGVSLPRLRNIVLDVYSPEIFCAELNTLLKEGTVAATWTSSRYLGNDYYGRNTMMKVTFIPKPIIIASGYSAFRIIKGEVVNFTDDDHEKVREPQVYIVEDGLPARVAKLDKKSASASAADILLGAAKA